MRALKILNLALYFFITLMLFLIAGYDLSSSLLDPTMSYLNDVPATIKSQTGWQFRYFSINIFSLIISITLIVIGIFYYKKGENSTFWAFAYYVSFMVVLAIAALLIYLITLEPANIQQ